MHTSPHSLCYVHTKLQDAAVRVDLLAFNSSNTLKISSTSLFVAIATIQFLSSAAQVVLRLDRVPERDALCPSDQLLLFCTHNDTFNDPEWRVINGTQVIHRGITFHGSTLEAHSLVKNTNVLEVLEIDKVQPNFHNLRYSCLYDTHWGERKSNEITVKLHGRCVCATRDVCLYTCVHVHCV